MMVRRLEGMMLVVVLAIAGLLSMPRVEGMTDRPNILFIMADDLGFNDLSIHGSPHIKTPNIDAIANNGVQFTTAFSLAGFCSPARAGFLTGKNPSTFGHYFNPAHTHEDIKAGLPLDQTVIPETLKKSGYATSIIGKWHLGFHPKLTPKSRGFEDFHGFLGGRFSYNEPELFDTPNQLWEYVYDNYSVPKTVKHLTIKFTDDAIEFISNQQGNEDPFFMFLSYNAPHGPLEYIPEDLDETIPPERQAYAAMVTRLDIEIGRLMAHLESLGIAENTLVVFTNDNGGQLMNNSSNFPFRGDKGSYREGGIRVPMFVQWKGTILPEQIVDHPVTLMDMFPTFQELAQVAAEDRRTDLDGVDLMPYIPKVDGSSHLNSAPHEYVIMGSLREGMVRKGKYKLWVKDFAKNDTRLHDMTDARPEQRNIKWTRRQIHWELYQVYVDWYLKNPTEPAFPEELRENPLSLTLVEPPGPYVTARPFTFWTSVEHRDGLPITFTWEVFRPKFFHTSTFLEMRTRKVPFTDIGQFSTLIFTSRGRWTIRVNISAGDFTKWEEVTLKVV